MIDWIREHGGARSAIRVAPEVVAPDILASTTTVKVALDGAAQSAACRRVNAPPIAADEKARAFFTRQR
ncbi:hypothetical protein [Kitasatospora sp. NPDC057541]|uniref:hypothetical protein n=1 Tax=unclassified Kitasatospora TaxID=2633591 RepID=UPI0036B67A07